MKRWISFLDTFQSQLDDVFRFQKSIDKINGFRTALKNNLSTFGNLHTRFFDFKHGSFHPSKTRPLESYLLFDSSSIDAFVSDCIGSTNFNAIVGIALDQKIAIYFPISELLSRTSSSLDEVFSKKNAYIK